MSGREASGSAEPGPAPPLRVRRRRRADEAGFTLLEALVALMVVGLAVAGSLEAASRALAGQDRATRHAEATALAEERLNEIGVLSRDSLAGHGAAGWSRLDLSGRVYHRRSSVRRAEDDENLWRVTAEVGWSGGRVELGTIFYRPPDDPAEGRLR